MSTKMADAEAQRPVSSDDTFIHHAMSSSDGTDVSVAKREQSDVGKRVLRHAKNVGWRVLNNPYFYTRMTTEIAVLCTVLFFIVRSYVKKQHST